MHLALAQGAHIASSIAPQHLSLAVPGRRKIFLLKNNAEWNFHFITKFTYCRFDSYMFLASWCTKSKNVLGFVKKLLWRLLPFAFS
jgi:hypothetical protein